MHKAMELCDDIKAVAGVIALRVQREEAIDVLKKRGKASSNPNLKTFTNKSITSIKNKMATSECLMGSPDQLLKAFKEKVEELYEYSKDI